MALADLDLKLRSSQTGDLDADDYDATLVAIQAAVNALNAATAPLTVSLITGAKVGQTAGWVVNDAVDGASLAKCPGGQTSATLVVPLSGLPLGRKLTGYTVRGQVDSSGDTGTLDAALYKATVAEGGITDAAVTTGAITQVVATADAVVAAAVTGLVETLAAGASYYLLLTATTEAFADFNLSSVDVTLTVP